MDGVLVQVVDVGPGELLLLDSGHGCPHTLLILLFKEVGKWNNETNIERLSVVVQSVTFDSFPGP